ncbi:BTAD domain-containing putative transcriptional regulator [Lentzea sp. NPDC058436]|uniref:BTAD domain-containing putative transcriptional regulator n=1 Tax=Lentzea sp. NPDC058436 TaxID=3346499 RepID=UPI00365674E1
MTTDVTAPLAVDLLGVPRVRRDGQDLSLGPARQRAVFAALALRAGSVVSRSELVAAVWGESAPSSAEGSLHTYVSGLRKSLEPGRSRWSTGQLLISGNAGYALRIAPDDCDVFVFERLRELADRKAREGDLSSAARQLDAALGLWRGEALSGVPGPNAERERDRLAELRFGSMERRAEIQLALGADRDLVAELTTLLGRGPLREHLRGLLMTALHNSGRRAEALRVFQDGRRVLHDELGVEPGPELTALHAEILAGDGGRIGVLPAPGRAQSANRPRLVAPAGVVSAMRRARGTDRRFVGRAAELALLRGAADALVEGRGGVLWVEGEAGIGKSELLAVAFADAQARGVQVAWAVADEFERGVPLRLVVDALGIDPQSPDPRRSALADQIRGGAADETGGRLWEATDQLHAAVNQVLAFVAELCADGPLVLVTDDLQWADEASTLVWHRLCAAVGQMPLLLVASTRSTPRSPLLDQLGRDVAQRGGEVVRLAPLGCQDVHSLIERIVGAAPGPGLSEAATRTAGNPLFLKELTEGLVRDGALVVGGGVADLAQAEEFRLPASLAAAVGRRLAGLSAPVRALLRWAAVLGTQFEVSDAAAVLGVSPFDLLDVVEEAVAAEVVVEAGAQLAFRHPLFRQALYEAVAPEALAELHEQAARALADAGAPVSKVTEQLVASAGPLAPWALDWLHLNVASLVHRAPELVAGLLERALEVCEEDDPRREAFVANLVKVLFRLGRTPVGHARHGLALASTPADVAEMRHLLANVLFRSGDRAEAIAELTAGIAAPDVPPVWLARHQSLLVNFRRGEVTDLVASQRRADEAYAQAETAGDLYCMSHALQTQWQLATIRREHHRALDAVNHALGLIAADSQYAELYLDLLDNKIFTLHNVDRLDTAYETLRHAREVAAKFALPKGLQVTAAVHHFWTGAWDDALAELDDLEDVGPAAMTFYGQRAPGGTRILLHGVAGYVAVHRQQGSKAAFHLDAVQEISAESGAQDERENSDFVLMGRALVAEQQGRLGCALDVLEPVLDPAHAPMMLRHQWLPHITRLALDVSDHARLERALAVAAAEKSKEDGEFRAATAWQVCEGLRTGDPEPLVAAVRHHADSGRWWEHAEASEHAAIALAAGGFADDAESALADALAGFRAAGATWDFDRALRRARRAGVARRGVAPARPERTTGLTPTESKIARLVAAGLPNPSIAAAMDLSDRVVQAHVSRIAEKLGARSRSEVAARMLAGSSGW